MVCRLCLVDAQENYVALFNSSELNNESKLLKLITKYFQMELTPDDPVSTTICNKCCKQLNDFHEFWTFVDEQQSKLQEKIKDKQILREEEIDYPADTTDDLQVDLNYLYPDEGRIDVKIEPSNDSLNCDEANEVDMPDDSWCGSSDDDVPLVKRLKTSTTVFKQRLRKDKKTKLSSASKKRTKKKRSSTKGPNGSVVRAAQKRNEDLIISFMKVQCDICKADIESFHKLRQHFNELHEEQAYLICCGVKYTKPSKLVMHIDWHKNPEASTCEICNKRLFSKQYLKDHKLRKHGIKDKDGFCCTECNKSFLSKKCLQNHLLKCDHETTYNCHLCEKSFVNSHRLKRHIESIHENKFSHVCDFCGKKFKFKPSFEKHVLEHQGIVDPPVQCDECGDWLKNSSSLRLHRFKHEKKEAICRYCGKRCVSRSALYRHISYAHRLQKNLKCAFCEKTFKEPRNLDEHVAIHTGAQLYSCPHCSKECRSKSNMYVHIKRYHPAEWINQKKARSHDPRFKDSMIATNTINEDPTSSNI